MKRIFYICFSILIVSQYSCEKCEEIVTEPCGNEFGQNSEHCGWSVFTCFAWGAENKPNPTEKVAVLIDTRYNSEAPIGANWDAPMVVPDNWNYGSLGQIFGIAIDNSDNIYLASSDIYSFNGNENSSQPFAQIYKCTPPSFHAEEFISLPNSGGEKNGIGNICYDKWNDQLFASNIEDGTIYRIDINTGEILEKYDPLSADDGLQGVAPDNEQVWGIGVNKEDDLVKLYFSIGNTVYSKKITNGVFDSSLEEIEIEITFTNILNKISDISFSSDGFTLLLAERGNPHTANVIGYSKLSGDWTLLNNFHSGGSFPANPNEGSNCAGGVDFFYSEIEGNKSSECDKNFFVTANYMMTENSGLQYGIQGINIEGNNPSDHNPSDEANSSTDVFIGLGVQKNLLGDVEVFDCSECGNPCNLNNLIK